MRPTLRQLQYIVAVADTGRFGDAARSLNVSQPSLSAQIAEIELDLQIDLFERGRHGAIPTPVGAELVQRARLILSAVQELRALARRAKSESLKGEQNMAAETVIDLKRVNILRPNT